MKPFEIEVQHSAETVSDLTRAQYALSHKTARLIQVVTAVVCLLIGVHAIGSVAEPFNYFFSLYGCLAIVFINVPASSLAGRVVEQIQKSGKPFPCSVFVFGEKDFNVRPTGKSRQQAEKEKVDIRLYRVIYQAIEDINAARVGLLSPDIVEEDTGIAEVRETFKVPKVGTIAGCYVVEGEIHRDDKVRIVRDGTVIFEGHMASLRRFKDDV